MTRAVSELLDLAKRVACEAGQGLREKKSDFSRVHQNAGKDIKLAGDFSSEEIIIRSISRESSYPILSEERGWVGRAPENDFHWIVDPLDGSMNYSREVPVSCVSIGLWKGKEPVLGLVHDFNRNELFSGIVGEGAWLNDRHISVSTVDSMASAILSTGFPSGMQFDQATISQFVNQVLAYKKIRMFGSAGISLAYVACGRVDAYLERDIMLWDIAGGLPVILGAGGFVDIQPGKKGPHAFDIFASNGKVKPR